MSEPDSTPIVALSPDRTRADIAALASEVFDVLVIGGGIVGAGVALDGATRGLSVAIVEAEDWAAGTSSRSSKLIHGGLRYVKSRELSLVREALRERSILLNLAPHLVRSSQFLYPLRHRIERPYVATGLGLYDLLARLPGSPPGALPKARYLDAASARTLAPALRHNRVVGGFLYYDAQVDDARYVLDVVRSAASYGARAVSRARVVGFVEERGRICGARVQLHETGDEIVVRARAVISATGVWSEELGFMAGADGPRLRPSKGIHLVVARDAIDLKSALVVPTSQSLLFVLPWGTHWIVGTTDTPWALGPGQPVATSTDIEYLLAELNAILAEPIDRSAVESVYVGLRPLLAGGADPTTKLSREHAVSEPRPGLTFIAGGKYTTYRLMARDALDAAVKEAGLQAGDCRTDSVLIAGAAGFEEMAERPTADLVGRTGLSPLDVDRLLGRYGSLVSELLDFGASTESFQPLQVSGYLQAEVRYAVTHEGARHLDDVLCRRTRIAMETADRGLGAAGEVANLMAPLLGWSATVVAEQINHYRTSILANEQAEQLPDDHAAHDLVASHDSSRYSYLAALGEADPESRT